MKNSEECIAYLECLKGVFPERVDAKPEVYCGDVPDMPLSSVGFGARGCVEGDAGKLQIIASVVLVDSTAGRVLLVRKPDEACPGSPEARSSLLWVGGHAREDDLSPSMKNLRQFARDAAERECFEELGIFAQFIEFPPFYVYSTFEKHSKRHLAVCFVALLEDDTALRIDEKELVGRSREGMKSGEFISLDGLGQLDYGYPFERWSEKIAEHLNCRRCELREAVAKRLNKDAGGSRRELFAGFIGDGAIDGRYRLHRREDGSFRKLGEGGSGIVYLARQGLVMGVGVQRAIKFFLFDSERIDEEETEVSNANFAKEIDNIVRFNHQNILKVIDGGYIDNSIAAGYGAREPIPYLVTEFVDGHTLKDYLEKRDLSILEVVEDETHAFELVLQLLDGIDYLHGRQFYHCDIAPKNLFFQGMGRESVAVLGDLGAGVTLSEESRAAYGGSKLRVIGTRGYSPEPVKNLIENLASVSFDEFKSLQPQWDSFAARKTIVEFCRKASSALLKGGLRHKSLLALAARLESLEGEFGIEDLRRAVKGLHPGRRTVADVPELTEASGETSTRPLPPSPVVLSHRFRAIIEHPAFARLQGVPQLFSIPTVFPSANHTRYEHSLGTYEVMRRVLISLLRREQVASILDRKSIELALLGALLLSVNRFPFWYVFREMGRSLGGEGSFEEFDSQLFDRVLGDSSKVGSLAWTIRREFSDVDLEVLRKVVCLSHLDGSESDFLRLVHVLLHSSLDVRVLDYLMRDAYHIGREGLPDFSPLYEHLDFRDGRLAVHSRGVSYAEQVATQRYWMFKTVYWNQPNRLYNAALTHVLCRLPGERVNRGIIENLDRLTTHRMLEMLSEVSLGEGDCEAEGFIRRHLSDNPPHFSRLFAASGADSNLPDGLRTFFEQYRRSSHNRRERVRSELQKALEKEFGLEESRECRVLIDIPGSAPSDMGADILVISNDGERCQPLPEQSGIIQGINDHFDEQLRWLRVFGESEWMASLVDTSDRSKRVREIVIEVLSGFATDAGKATDPESIDDMPDRGGKS